MDTSIILGQGIAGSTLAWRLHWAGHRVLLIDRGEEITASRIAAGLITPVTGIRFTKAEDFDVCRAQAEEHYRRVEGEVNGRLLETEPAIRLFMNDPEREYFLKERASVFSNEVELIVGRDGEISGFRMLKAGRLRVQHYLNATRKYFEARGQYQQADVDVTKDIEPHEQGVRLRNPEIEGTRLFFCQGFEGQSNPWFPGMPDAPSQGQILKVRIPGRTDQRVIHRGYWLAPGGSSDSEGDHHDYVIGATYDRENLTGRGSDQGREELGRALSQITTETAEITGHQAAIRAGTRNRRPICQVHLKYPQLAILNGLGSKASLLAPLVAQQLTELLSKPALTKAESRKKSRSLTSLAHRIAGRAMRPGDTVIDATAGNGHDTVFLAQSVGQSGQVIAIDIQESAIESTRSRLEANGISKVQLIVADHSEVLNRMAEENRQVRVIMFNLGYLPGGSRQLTTCPESTVHAIQAGLRILEPGGVITVIAYRGHAGGQQEAQAVENLARTEEGSLISVDRVPGTAENPESPVLYVFRRKL